MLDSISSPVEEKEGAKILGRWLALLALAGSTRVLLALSRSFERLSNRLYSVTKARCADTMRRNDHE